jgi:hypothetical protein
MSAPRSSEDAGSRSGAFGVVYYQDVGLALWWARDRHPCHSRLPAPPEEAKASVRPFQVPVPFVADTQVVAYFLHVRCRKR